MSANNPNLAQHLPRDHTLQNQTENSESFANGGRNRDDDDDDDRSISNDDDDGDDESRDVNEEDDDFLVSAPVHDLDFSENDRSLNEIPDSSDHESVKEKYTMEQIHTRLFRIKPTEGNNFI